jgi:hypothetical protein
MSKIKGLDARLLPPCETVLFQQFFRANSIFPRWNFATDAKLHISPPEKMIGGKKQTNPVSNHIIYIGSME